MAGIHSGAVEPLLPLAVFETVHHLASLSQVGHAILRKRSPDDAARQVFHGPGLPGRNPQTAVNVEARVPPKEQAMLISVEDF
jgi:hypothetical protein